MLQTILGLLTLSGFAGFLALCLEVADMYFANYGECDIRINDGEREYTVQGGGHLLGALGDQGIFVPSACGGRGSCGLCKLRVLEGAGPLLPTETPYLSPEERANHVRLSCQVKVRNNLSIQIPPELFLIREYSARVERIRNLTEDIKEIRLSLLEPDTMEFKGGQYIQFEIPEYAGADEPVYRAYSLASGPGEPRRLTLIVTRVPDGVASTYIHTELREGNEVRINGPYGEFYLRESARDILMVATGSGLAPIMSLLHQMADQRIQRKATVVFGARQRKDLFYLEELEGFKERIPSLEVIFTLSRPSEEDRWQGERGRVTEVIPKIVHPGHEVEAYICGNPAMVESCEELLVRLGVPRERIYYDKFT